MSTQRSGPPSLSDHLNDVLFAGVETCLGSVRGHTNDGRVR